MGGLTPNSTASILTGSGAGSFAVPGGACAGTIGGLQSGTVRLVASRPTGPNGAFVASPNLGASQCGKFLQVLDLATCRFTPVDQLP